MRYFIKLREGEGLAGSETVGMATSKLYNCMGIAFVNQHTRRAGLYHYPSGSIEDPDVRGTITQMYNDITPDAVVITPAHTQDVPLMQSGKVDIKDVRKFLRGLGGAVDILESGGVVSRLHWNQHEAVFNASIPANARIVRVPFTIRSELRTSRRISFADTWYYGGDPKAIARAEGIRLPVFEEVDLDAFGVFHQPVAAAPISPFDSPFD